MHTYVLLFQCPDQKGIVAAITGALLALDCNVLDADQHSTAPTGGQFFMRVAFTAPEAGDKLHHAMDALAQQFDAAVALHNTDRRLRMGLLVSKQGHCLADLLYRTQTGELPLSIPLVISNHPDQRDLVQHYGIKFEHLPVTRDDKQEDAILQLFSDADCDFLVLARYMQILSENFLQRYGRNIINIHHSFLPSFQGSKPYHQALARGVKVIGATAHFVTAELDEGPIIHQEVMPVSHRDDLRDLVRKGRNTEKLALAHAVHAYVDHRVLRFGDKTIVF